MSCFTTLIASTIVRHSSLILNNDLWCVVKLAKFWYFAHLYPAYFRGRSAFLQLLLFLVPHLLIVALWLFFRSWNNSAQMWLRVQRLVRILDNFFELLGPNSRWRRHHSLWQLLYRPGFVWWCLKILRTSFVWCLSRIFLQLFFAICNSILYKFVYQISVLSWSFVSSFPF